MILHRMFLHKRCMDVSPNRAFDIRNILCKHIQTQCIAFHTFNLYNVVIDVCFLCRIHLCYDKDIWQ